MALWAVSAIFGWGPDEGPTSPLGESRTANANMLRSELRDLPFRMEFDSDPRPSVVSGTAVNRRNGVEADFAFSVGPKPRSIARDFPTGDWAPSTLLRDGEEAIILARYKGLPSNVLAWRRDVAVSMMNRIENVTCNLAFGDDCLPLG